jgi:hypothetical protein
MSFFYPSKWGGMGGYSMGAWTPGDFTAEEIQRSTDAGNAIEMMTLVAGEYSVKATDTKEKNVSAIVEDGIKTLQMNNGLDPTKGLLSIDDDEKIYAVHAAIDKLSENTQISDALRKNLDNAISTSTQGRHADLDALVALTGQVYEDYFDKYYEDDKGAPAGAPKPPVADATTGKVKVPKAKQTVKKAGIGVAGWMAVAVIAGGGAYLAYQAATKRR